MVPNIIPPVPVRPNINGLQVLWLQESGIDRLWGKPFVPVIVQRPADDAVAVESGINEPGNRAKANLSARLPEASPLPTQRAVASQPAVAQRPVRNFASQQPAPETTKDVPSPVVLRPDLSQLDWPGLRESVANCNSCNLGEHRRQAVFGEGAQPSDWMFVEEAPGEQDDWHGRPFMGKAGTLFDNILKSVHLGRETVFISPLVKCRPIANIAPSKEAAASCMSYLQAQIERVQPKCIVVFGRAANLLLGSTETVEALRAKDWFISTANGKQIPLVVTYHPNHLMVAHTDKAKVWQDLQKALRIVRSAN